MNAQVLITHGIDNYKFTKLPIPKPKKNHVVIRVYACAINNTDIWTKKGLYSKNNDHGWNPSFKLPIIQGADISGVIHSTDNDHQKIIGKKVIIYPVINTKKFTIASTGMASLPEIKKIYKLFCDKSINLGILHCVSSYPNFEDSSYLSNISYLKKKFKCPIGISDHTNDIKIPIYGALLGANIIEKHIKINNEHKCVDSPVSITGKQLKILRIEVDKISKILNKPKFGVRPEETAIKIFKRKKIYN